MIIISYSIFLQVYFWQYDPPSHGTYIIGAAVGRFVVLLFTYVHATHRGVNLEGRREAERGVGGREKERGREREGERGEEGGRVRGRKKEKKRELERERERESVTYIPVPFNQVIN